MRIGPLHVMWLRRNRLNGRRVLPWEALTAEELSDQARVAIARVARSMVKDLLQDADERTFAAERLIDNHLAVFHAHSDSQQWPDGSIGLWPTNQTPTRPATEPGS